LRYLLTKEQMGNDIPLFDYFPRAVARCQVILNRAKIFPRTPRRVGCSDWIFEIRVHIQPFLSAPIPADHRQRDSLDG